MLVRECPETPGNTCRCIGSIVNIYSLYNVTFNQRRPSPSEAMMHFPPVSDFPLFSKFFYTFLKISKILSFPQKISHIHRPKFLTTFLLVIDHTFRISPLFFLFQHISPDSRKFIISSLLFKISPLFYKIQQLFTYFTCIYS